MISGRLLPLLIVRLWGYDHVHSNNIGELVQLDDIYLKGWEDLETAASLRIKQILEQFQCKMDEYREKASKRKREQSPPKPELEE